MNLSEQTYRIKDLMGLNLLNEGVSINTEDEWCKTNLTDSANQICIIKTPNSGDQATCVKSTGPLARQNGYPSNILSDVSEENFCKTIWGKITS